MHLSSPLATVQCPGPSWVHWGRAGAFEALAPAYWVLRPLGQASSTSHGLNVQPDPRHCVLSPGVTLRPDTYGDKGLDISYNVSDNRTWTGLTQALRHFLAGKVTQALRHFLVGKGSHRPCGPGPRSPLSFPEELGGGRAAARAGPQVRPPQATRLQPRRTTSTARPRGTSSRSASWPRTTPSFPASSRRTCCRTAPASPTPPSVSQRESRASLSR